MLIMSTDWRPGTLRLLSIECDTNLANGTVHPCRHNLCRVNINLQKHDLILSFIVMVNKGLKLLT